MSLQDEIKRITEKDGSIQECLNQYAETNGLSVQDALKVITEADGSIQDLLNAKAETSGLGISDCAKCIDGFVSGVETVTKVHYSVIGSITSAYPDSSSGSSTVWVQSNCADGIRRTMFKYSIPSDIGEIQSIKIKLKNNYSGGTQREISIHEITREVWYSSASWNNSEYEANPWATPGGDFETTAINSGNVADGYLYLDLLGGNAVNPISVSANDNLSVILKYTDESGTAEDYTGFDARAIEFGEGLYLEITSLK